MLGLWIALGVVAFIAILVVISYNRFVSQRNLIDNAWANIDTELRRRYDLIPNLIETVRGYAAHERAVFENVTRARAMAAQATGSPAEQAAAEGPLIAALRQLFAVAEAYPQLQANQNFLALQAELANTEDRIQTSRRFYNNNVQDFNRRVQSFPSMIVARMFGFREREFFEIDAAIREAGPPRVDFGAPPAAAYGPPGGGTAPVPTGGGGGPPTAPPGGPTTGAPTAPAGTAGATPSSQSQEPSGGGGGAGFTG